MKYYNVEFYKDRALHFTTCRVYSDIPLTVAEIRKKLKDIGFNNISFRYISGLKDDK